MNDKDGKSMNERLRSFSESLDFINQGFKQMSIDEQREFLEFFSGIIESAKEESRKNLLMRFRSLLESEMRKKFNNWLKSEMKK